MEIEDNQIYRAVVNDEEQYSLWPAHKPVPPGWRDVGKPGTKEEVLDHISKVWTDIRPLTVRKRIAELNSQEDR